MALLSKADRLKKELSLLDVFAVSAGAMFSSGFFLLPGLAAAKSGPSVVLAYFLAALLALPALFSKAELSTAMPRAGGTYFFLDRSMGPMVGTIGGLGVWLSLSLKSAFALIGMGAYLQLVVGLPIKPVAAGLTVVIVMLNILGAKETSGLQRVLVLSILAVLVFFILEGLVEVSSRGFGDVRREQFTPFMPFGLEGVFSTVGLVFVSFAGLTKAASIPEEVRDADRNIPLGMMLSLGVATVIYVLGIGVMVSVLEPQSLHRDLTPVATAGQEIFGWLPEPLGLALVVVAAIAAFTAMANAGVLAASRYPLAMARDRIMSPALSELGRFRTPSRAIALTGAVMIAVLLLLDVEGVAKLASSLKLLIFSFVNLAVIIMRESELEAYDPGFSSPLYPWMQLAGFLVPLWLIVEIGALPLLFTLGVVLAGAGWYRFYAQDRISRQGAMVRVFDRWGEHHTEDLDRELRQILKEKGLREHDPFGELVRSATVLNVEGEREFADVIRRAAEEVVAGLPLSVDEAVDSVLEGTRMGMTPVSHGAALPHVRLSGLDHPRLVIVRDQDGIRIRGAGAAEVRGEAGRGDGGREVHAVFFLVSPEESPGQHLRILAKLASRVDEEDFLDRWRSAETEEELKEILLAERLEG